MAFYTRTELPTTYALADAYAISDNWFCSVMGPTWPNRFFLHAGTANGKQKNAPIWKKEIGEDGAEWVGLGP
jgi:phospholipase C